MANEQRGQVTGFERKPLRVVIENWLYNRQDLSVLMDATAELQKRFMRAFPMPEWAKQPVPRVDDDVCAYCGEPHKGYCWEE
jgi:hypothetical protein